MLSIQDIKKLSKIPITDEIARSIRDDFYILADLILDHLEEKLKDGKK